MKFKKNLKVLFVFLFSLSLFTVEVMAIHPSVLINKGFKQVVYEGEEVTNDGFVRVSKTIEETDIENYFDITLKVNSYNRVDEILKDQDLAIVIVMDISNTMNTADVTSGSKKIPRLEAAQKAAEKFIDDFATYAKNVEAVRKLGFVAFNTNANLIFNLQEVYDENGISKVSTLKSTMKTKTNDIALVDGYHRKVNRFTNIEAGLKRASDMLESSGIQNKYIIFISDGFPTTYIDSDAGKYKGYNPYMSSAYNDNFVVKDASNTNTFGYTASSPGIFFNEFSKLICKDGTDYSDEAARRATSMASDIKKLGTKIFSVGISLSDSRVIDKNSYLTDVDKEKYNAKGNFEVGSNGKQYKNWLKNTIGSGFYYDVTSTTELNNAYLQIFEKVKSYSEQFAEATWVAEDPMGVTNSLKVIEFVGFFDDTNLDTSLHDSIQNGVANQSDTATFNDNKISWDLKKSSYKEVDVSSNEKRYEYEIKYRVRLKNEEPQFNVDTIYNTNETTRLKYVVRNSDSVLSENKSIDFPIPQVVGYLGNFNFTKLSSFDQSGLKGAKFALVHADEEGHRCDCLDERKHVTQDAVTYYSESDDNGVVRFENIPSGHKYILKEISPPDNYNLSSDVYNVEVSYGEVSGVPDDLKIINNIKTTSLEIEKNVVDSVLGDVESSEVFKFKLLVRYNNQLVSGSVPYTITDRNGNVVSTGLLSLNDSLTDQTAIISLKHREKILITGLPAKSNYEIKELNTDGYEVSYIVNSYDEIKGSIASCNTENNCSLNAEGNNKVQFINLKGYVLPATGSSGMLILTIIGILLFGTPIIYIGYSFYENEWRLNRLQKK